METSRMETSAGTTAFIALGSNLGDRVENLRTAIEKLVGTPGIQVHRVSTPLENPAVGGPADSPSFLNAAAELRTTLSAAALLHRLLEIEKEMGRLRRQRWEPRTIDLDLLLFGDEIHSTQSLMIPHPLMHERRFVLQPLAEIAPNVLHPTLQMSIAGLLEAITANPYNRAP
jgi:2-amino-4-hydroxy-6-hydroxymethyldihydropteridine diphosphokinase